MHIFPGDELDWAPLLEPAALTLLSSAPLDLPFTLVPKGSSGDSFNSWPSRRSLKSSPALKIEPLVLGSAPLLLDTLVLLLTLGAVVHLRTVHGPLSVEPQHGSEMKAEPRLIF